MMAIFEAAQLAFRQLADTGGIAPGSRSTFRDLTSVLGVPETLAAAKRYDT
jgi:hypothetical protein